MTAYSAMPATCRLCGNRPAWAGYNWCKPCFENNPDPTAPTYVPADQPDRTLTDHEQAVYDLLVACARSADSLRPTALQPFMCAKVAAIIDRLTNSDQ